MKSQLKKSLNVLIVSILMLCSFSLYAQEPHYIRVGLEGVYKDAPEIKLEGENSILIGYTEQERFYTLGTLNHSQINIKPSSGTYYYYSDTYNTFKQAQQAANKHEGAIAAYIAPDVFMLYTNNSGVGSKASNAKQMIEVYDETGSLIMIANASTTPLAFQGHTSTYDFAVTGVGDNKKYRGAIEIVKGETKGLTAVNVIDMETYLYGVVPAEMIPSWSIEALKAQAVASRSIATFQYNRHIKKGYNVVDTTITQAYKGVSIETKRTTQAVEETKQEIALYNGKVAETLYYSTSGGYTEDPKYVWGNEIDYLKALPDPYETQPEQKPWTRIITMKEIDKCLANVGATIGNAQGLKIISRTPSGRVQELQVIGTKGLHTLTKESTRTFFSGTNEGSLKSRMFNFSSYAYTTSGDGFGIHPSGEVSIMSEDDLVETLLDKLYAISQHDIAHLSDTIWVQNDTGLSKLNVSSNGSTTDTNVIQSSEVIYGDFTVYGEGFGHGVGMSQSGAKGMADAGYDYKEIMTYYFPGIKIQ